MAAEAVPPWMSCKSPEDGELVCGVRSQEDRMSAIPVCADAEVLYLCSRALRGISLARALAGKQVERDGVVQDQLLQALHVSAHGCAHQHALAPPGHLHAVQCHKLHTYACVGIYICL